MTQGVSGGVQGLQFHGLAHSDHSAGGQRRVQAGDLGLGVGQQTGAGGGDHRGVAADMVPVFMGVQHLGDLPAPFLGASQAFFVRQGVHGQGLAGLRTGDEIVEIAPVVAGPNLLDDHGSSVPPGRHSLNPPCLLS